MLIILLILITSSACWVVKAESLKLPERSGHDLAAGLYIRPNCSKTIMMFSMSHMSRTAFMALSEVQVARLQMF